MCFRCAVTVLVQGLVYQSGLTNAGQTHAWSISVCLAVGLVALPCVATIRAHTDPPVDRPLDALRAVTATDEKTGRTAQAGGPVQRAGAEARGTGQQVEMVSLAAVLPVAGPVQEHSGGSAAAAT
jgi:hypothetical protein